MKRLPWFAIAIVVAGLIWLVLEATTPAECKVPTEQMSAACLSLVQP
jgi:hypothetical protein